MSGKGDDKRGNYGVANGRQTGVFNKWGDAKAQVSGYSNAEHKNFKTESQAQQFVSGRDPCPKARYYAVTEGRNPGVYTDWKHGAQPQVDGCSNAQHKSFSNYDSAAAYMNNPGNSRGASGYQ